MTVEPQPNVPILKIAWTATSPFLISKWKKPANADVALRSIRSCRRIHAGWCNGGDMSEDVKWETLDTFRMSDEDANKLVDKAPGCAADRRCAG